MTDDIRIKVKHIDRLTRNMHVDILTKSNEVKTGYFKRFVCKDQQGKNLYRSSIQELQSIVMGLQPDAIGLFFTDSEQDPPKVQNQQQGFVKTDSVLIKNIKEIYLIPPAALVPFIQKLQQESDNMKDRVSLLETQIQKMNMIMSKITEKSKKSKHST